MARRAIAVGCHGVGNRGDRSVVVSDECECHGLVELRRALDAQGISRHRHGVELDTDVHILACGASEALTGPFGRFGNEIDSHFPAFVAHGCV